MKCMQDEIGGQHARPVCLSVLSVFKHVTVGSLSNNGGDGNENGIKAIDLDWQNNNYGRSLRSKRFRVRRER